MKIETFLAQIRAGEKVSFQDSIALIAEHYQYTPMRFVNGTVINEAGTNEGSCKLFYFAKLHGLTAEQTLALFGDYYWKDVLENAEGTNHANIRSFMQHGWGGVSYAGEALSKKKGNP